MRYFLIILCHEITFDFLRFEIVKRSDIIFNFNNIFVDIIRRTVTGSLARSRFTHRAIHKLRNTSGPCPTIRALKT